MTIPILPPRSKDSHKGDFGRALLIGGSRGMSGAIALAGMAALRGGAGLVRLAVPDCCLDVVASYEPSYMTVPLANDSAGHICIAARETLLEHLASATTVACGPGLGRSAEITELVHWLYQTVSAPMVLDADALNALAERPELLATHAGPRILTPHPGEFQRLVGGAKQGREAAEITAKQLATRCNVIVVLKGHHTLVTNGDEDFLNNTGNPGMATGGSGDVLTGLVTALIGQHLSPFDAAKLGVHLHGLAGDLAAAKLGQVSLIARDLVRFLPAAFRDRSSHTDSLPF